jgi:hypothetical protein
MAPYSLCKIYGLWSKVVHYLRNWAPFGTHIYMCLPHGPWVCNAHFRQYWAPSFCKLSCTNSLDQTDSNPVQNYGILSWMTSSIGVIWRNRLKCQLVSWTFLQKRRVLSLSRKSSVPPFSFATDQATEMSRQTKAAIFIWKIVKLLIKATIS